MPTVRFITLIAACGTISAATVRAQATPAAAKQVLRGSPSSVDLMYNTAHVRDLQFLRTPADIYEATKTGALQLISVTRDLELNRVQYPFVLPNTLRFADSLAKAYHRECGERIVVTSGARAVDKQPRNASPKSVHPTGMAIDFRKPRTPACLEWLRLTLANLEKAGVIEATEEKHPPHFHVAVLHQRPAPHIQMAAGDVALPQKAASSTPARSKKTAPAQGSAKRTAASASKSSRGKPVKHE
jgi:uncharacterized protein YcbK (DUF882 family)